MTSTQEQKPETPTTGDSVLPGLARLRRKFRGAPPLDGGTRTPQERLAQKRAKGEDTQSEERAISRWT